MLSVIMLRVVMLKVVAHKNTREREKAIKNWREKFDTPNHILSLLQIREQTQPLSD
jgi:hypothetical protein